MSTCPPPQLVFGEIISKRTCYGLIWAGQYNKHPCAIKMIMLTSGIHYDKNIGEYMTSSGDMLPEDQINRYFDHNDPIPFMNIDFRHRRSMTPEAFLSEIDDLIGLSKLGIAPIVYGYGINLSHDIHYGFIIMEKVDCSLKDIYLSRNLSKKENKLVIQAIEQLHDEHGIIHGDLKPSNIGVYLDTNRKIQRVCFFDCQKNKHKGDYTVEEFTDLGTRELGNYQKHIAKNIKER